jgi:hypothetical protein
MKKRCRASLVSALFGLLVGAAALLPAGCGSTAASLSPSAPAARSETSVPRKFKFRTIVDPANRTFNEALGINDGRTVAGYYGGGVGNARQGYTAVPPFSKKDFTSENYPGASQTQVTAINGSGDTAGVWTDSSGGFTDSSTGTASLRATTILTRSARRTFLA